jgi:predicted nucleic acid-binding Zn ribbon protein
MPPAPPAPARAPPTGQRCPVCQAPLTGRQTRACSGRCRAALSRQQRAAAQAAELHRLRATAGPWRFRVEPRGQRFLFVATTYLSDRETGIVETYDPHFAAWLRELARSARIEEVSATLGG